MRTTKQHSSTWGPKALAVVSFALALLAIQPVVTSATTVPNGAVLVRESAASPATGMPELARFSSQKRRSTARPEEPRRASTRQLHILATIEIVQRLLASELRPVEQHISPLAWFEPVCVETLIPPSLADTGLRNVLTWRAFAPPHAQESFLIEHCLLAPPVA